MLSGVHFNLKKFLTQRVKSLNDTLIATQLFSWRYEEVNLIYNKIEAHLLKGLAKSSGGKFCWLHHVMICRQKETQPLRKKASLSHSGFAAEL